MLWLTTFLFTIGFVLTLYLRRRRLAAERIRQLVMTWPRTAAQLLDPVPQPDRKAAKRSAGPGIAYQYQIRGQVYKGSHFTPQKDAIDRHLGSEALRILGRHDRWWAHYNPKDPGEAYLSPGLPQQRGSHIILEAYFLLIAPAVILYSWYGLLTHAN